MPVSHPTTEIFEAQDAVQRDLREGRNSNLITFESPHLFDDAHSHAATVEMLFAHMKRILRLGRLRLRGRAGPSSSSWWQQIA
jgi:hypothetical protein